MSEFIHLYEPAAAPDAPTLLLLHGTGGDERDLLPLAAQLAPRYHRLSPRGQVLENGAPRFFRRLAPGVLDFDDLARRTDELADFVVAAAARYGFDPGRVTALGYSNGANIATSLLLQRPDTLAGAALLRPMLLPAPPQLPDLRGKPVLILAGRGDPMVAAADPPQLAELLRRAGAGATVHEVGTGHGISAAEFTLVRDFLAGRLPLP